MEQTIIITRYVSEFFLLAQTSHGTTFNAAWMVMTNALFPTSLNRLFQDACRLRAATEKRLSQVTCTTGSKAYHIHSRAREVVFSENLFCDYS